MILSVCMLASVPFRVSPPYGYIQRKCVFDCVSVFVHVCAASQFLLSRLCVIVSEPAKPFVCVLPCAYINYVALLNNAAKETNLEPDFQPLYFQPPSIYQVLFFSFSSINIKRQLRMPVTFF